MAKQDKTAVYNRHSWRNSLQNSCLANIHTCKSTTNLNTKLTYYLLKHALHLPKYTPKPYNLYTNTKLTKNITTITLERRKFYWFIGFIRYQYHIPPLII